MEMLQMRQISSVNTKQQKYPTYDELLAKAHQSGLISITVRLIQAPAYNNKFTAIASATVTFDKVAYTEIGDANSETVGDIKFLPYIIRIAATRAKVRALRDALNVEVPALEQYPIPTSESVKVKQRETDQATDILEKKNAGKPRRWSLPAVKL